MGRTLRVDWQDLARRQAGVTSRRQLAEAGVRPMRIDGLVRRRDIVELLPRVYTPRPVPGSMQQRLWAAALWSGGVVSHWSAARLWQLPVAGTTTVHITVADRRFREPVPGVKVHRVPLECSAEVPFGGLPVTDRERTIIDLLRRERPGAARDLFDRAVQQGWVDQAALTRRSGVDAGDPVIPSWGCCWPRASRARTLSPNASSIRSCDARS
jgi:predicted transcriptional regulator of viral defense system